MDLMKLIKLGDLINTTKTKLRRLGKSFGTKTIMRQEGHKIGMHVMQVGRLAAKRARNQTELLLPARTIHFPI